jgi:hypothetical protein
MIKKKRTKKMNTPNSNYSEKKEHTLIIIIHKIIQKRIKNFYLMKFILQIKRKKVIIIKFLMVIIIKNFIKI